MKLEHFSVAMHNGQRLLWFKGSDIFVDANVWAECYELPIEDGTDAVVTHIRHLLGNVQIVFEEQLL
jgi:hypothetical protein